jgi:hypothetical protein
MFPLRPHRVFPLAATAAFLLLAPPAPAHHSFAAQYDASKQATLKGVVTKVEWTNPHIYIYIDVTGADGKVAKWALEGFPPNSLTRIGWTRHLIQEGDTISVLVALAKDGTNLGNMREVTLAGGRKLAAGAAQ